MQRQLLFSSELIYLSHTQKGPTGASLSLSGEVQFTLNECTYQHTHPLSPFENLVLGIAAQKKILEKREYSFFF